MKFDKMLEIINAFLLVYFLVLCSLSAFLPLLVKPISGCFTRPSSEDRKLWDETLALKKEQKKISMKDEFAAYSKLQRRINRLENILKDNSQTRLSKSLKVKGIVHVVLQVVIGLLMSVSVIYFRRDPIVALKANPFPIGSILKYPCDTPDAISTFTWVVISNISIRTLFRPLVT